MRRALAAAAAVLVAASVAHAAGPAKSVRINGPQLFDLRVDNGGNPFAGDSKLLTTVSPNGDGFRDAAFVHFQLKVAATVTMEVTRTVKVPQTSLLYSITLALKPGPHTLGWHPAATVN